MAVRPNMSSRLAVALLGRGGAVAGADAGAAAHGSVGGAVAAAAGGAEDHGSVADDAASAGATVGAAALLAHRSR